MISKDRTYRTRDGREAIVFCTEGVYPWPVLGAIRKGDGWAPHKWKNDGAATSDDIARHPDDLVESTPRFRREYWVNVYPDGDEYRFHKSEKDAHKCATENRIACKRIVIEGEEGDGL